MKINQCGTGESIKPQLRATTPLSTPSHSRKDLLRLKPKTAQQLLCHLLPFSIQKPHFSFPLPVGEGWVVIGVVLLLLLLLLRTCSHVSNPRFQSKRVGGHSQTSQTTKTHSSVAFPARVSIVFFPDELLKHVCVCMLCVSLCANVRGFTSLKNNKKRLLKKRKNERESEAFRRLITDLLPSWICAWKGGVKGFNPVFDK